ncbi:MAG TPA: hypothetical protein VLC06_09225, partial [Polyangia bacterium]|nr:hypothetical protein [Polyangia bacterium]
QEIQRFEDFSTGAHLVAALALATARTGEMVSSAEAGQIEKFHADHRKWLASYLLGGSCGGDCRGKLVNAMLSGYIQAQGDYDEPFRRLLMQPRAEAASAFAHLHTRFLWCQIDPDTVAQFRDRVLMPAFNQVAPDPTKPHPKTETGAIEDLVDLLALVPEPLATDAVATATWKKLVADLEHGADHLGRTYNARRAASAHERANPPPMIRKVNFCGAAALPDTTGGTKL